MLSFTNTFQGTPRFNKEASNQFLVYENSLIPPSAVVSFTHTPNWFIVEINGTYFKFNLKAQNITLLKDSWYGIVINLNPFLKLIMGNQFLLQF